MLNIQTTNSKIVKTASVDIKNKRLEPIKVSFRPNNDDVGYYAWELRSRCHHDLNVVSRIKLSVTARQIACIGRKKCAAVRIMLDYG